MSSKGSVVLVCDGEEHPLRRGETFYLHGRSFHLLKNVRKTTARAVGLDPSPVLTSIDIRKGYWNHA